MSNQDDYRSRGYTIRRTHGGRVGHLLAKDARRVGSWGREALCGHEVWNSAHTPDNTPICKACVKRCGKRQTQ